MIFLILLILSTKAIDHTCYGPHCYYPFIYHNFTNCPEYEIIMRRFGPPPPWVKKCDNEGTWGCSNFTAYYPYPDEGFVREGEIYYNLAKCCYIENVVTAITVIRPRLDDIGPPLPRRDVEIIPEGGASSWEWATHNIEVIGVGGTCIIKDERLEFRRGGPPPAFPYIEIPDCYEDNEELLHLVLELDYVDTPDTEWDFLPPRRSGWGGPDSCSMFLKFWVNGEVKHNSTIFTMDKFSGFQMEDFVMGMTRGMYKYEGEGEPNDEIHRIEMYNKKLPEWYILYHYENWRTITATDGICITDPCEEPDCEEHTIEVVRDAIRDLDFQIWYMIIVLIGIMVFMCCCWGGGFCVSLFTVRQVEKKNK